MFYSWSYIFINFHSRHVAGIFYYAIIQFTTFRSIEYEVNINETEL